jgi:cation-transporting ATPase E
MRFVVPAAVVTSLVGLVLLYGALALRFIEANDPSLTQAEIDRLLALATPGAQSVLTSFLVFTGLALVAFVEPPTRWLAVVRPLTKDRRPALLAVGLAIAYLVVMAFGTLRAVFALQPLRTIEWGILVVALAVWILVMRPVWRYRLVERFIGLGDAEG